MAEVAVKWKVPIWTMLLAGLVSFCLYIPALVFWWDLGSILYAFVFVPVVSIGVLIVVAVGRGKLSIVNSLAALLVFWTVSAVMFRCSFQLRSSARWFLESKRYKAQLLAQPAPQNGFFRHAVWDSWGFAGAGDTYVYLIYDPDNALSSELKSHSRGRFNGIPCEVFQLRKRQSGWYTAWLYTDLEWDQCANGNSARLK